MAESDRRDPDRLLADMQRAEARARRGRLKIFFGAAAGVGKTFSMLEAARAARRDHVDVVVGYVEPHGRVDTEQLLDGLEQLPPLRVSYRGMTRLEFDLDAALLRAPVIMLVDELAHSNLMEGQPRPRHTKRWHDIEELLAAGINVWTTLNVQHLESLNDVVAGITGIRQQETLPDRIFDEADEVELIDLPPDDLLDRLHSGRVYVPEQAATAVERFFRKPNLLALRELALRRTADRVDRAARAYSEADGSSQPWLARDRFLIAVAPDEQGEHLVRVGKRFADALDAEWLVVSVETPDLLRLGERARNRRVDVLRLAESLGAQTVTLDGPSASAALIDYARVRGVTRIVVGEARRRGWRAAWRPSTPAKLVRHGGGLDVSVIARRDPGEAIRSRRDRAVPAEMRWDRYWAALLVSGLCTGIAALMYPHFELTNLVMVYLLGATVAALRLGRGPAILTAVVNVAAFDFCFVPPQFTFAVTDLQYVVTFAVMLLVALIIASLVANVRAQTRVAGARERRTALLYAMSRELAAARTQENLAKISVKHVAETFTAQAEVLFPDAQGHVHQLGSLSPGAVITTTDLSVGQWVFDHGQPAGLGTDTLPAATAQYLPLQGTRGTLGVLAVTPSQRRRLLLPEQQHLLETFAGQIGLAIERALLAEEAEHARVAAETESLRNTLLGSISHDLRTPLAVIASASSALRDPQVALDAATRMRLATSIESKAQEMSEIISNVLDLMRFEAGEIKLRRDWQTVDDLVGTALHRLGDRLQNHPVEMRLPADLPPVHVDAPLVTQVFANLLENAARHTPPGSRIRISATSAEDSVTIVVEDNGPGLPPGDPDRLFAKFQRGHEESSAGGAGLGLAICRFIVNAHGGRISAEQHAGGGARFVFSLPTLEPAA
jgi:two-component system, OmpR family, sensor histidine kinase KdpD